MLPKKNRLDVKEFNRTLKKGKGYSGKFFYLKVLKNDEGKIMIGVAVSKKLGKSAVHRSYYKRLLRHLLTKSLPGLRAPYNIILTGKENIKDKKFEELEKDAGQLLQKTIPHQ